MLKNNTTEFSVVVARHEGFRLRMALSGAPKTGKSDGALECATAICKRMGLTRKEMRSAIVVIDAESRSSRRLARSKKRREREYLFSVIDLAAPYSPERYVRAMRAAIDAGAKVLIVDGISPEWSGPGGVLEIVDETPGRSKYTSGWREATPRHNFFINELLHCPAHLICTMRSKMEHATETTGDGKIKVRKIGLAPIQRDQTGYEFDILGECNQSLGVSFGESRCQEIKDMEFEKDERPDVWKIIADWLFDTEEEEGNDAEIQTRKIAKAETNLRRKAS